MCARSNTNNDKYSYEMDDYDSDAEDLLSIDSFLSSRDSNKSREYRNDYNNNNSGDNDQYGRNNAVPNRRNTSRRRDYNNNNNNKYDYNNRGRQRQNTQRDQYRDRDQDDFDMYTKNNNSTGYSSRSSSFNDKRDKLSQAMEDNESEWASSFSKKSMNEYNRYKKYTNNGRDSNYSNNSNNDNNSRNRNRDRNRNRNGKSYGDNNYNNDMYRKKRLGASRDHNNNNDNDRGHYKAMPYSDRGSALANSITRKQINTEKDKSKKPTVSLDQIKQYLEQYGIRTSGTEEEVKERAMAWRQVSSVPSIDSLRQQLELDTEFDDGTKLKKKLKKQMMKGSLDDDDGVSNNNNVGLDELETKRRRTVKIIRNFMSSNVQLTAFDSQNSANSNRIKSSYVNLDCFDFDVKALLNKDEIEKALEVRQEALQKMVDRVERKMQEEAFEDVKA